MLLNIFMSAITAALEFTFLYVFGLGIWGAALATCTGHDCLRPHRPHPFLRGRMTLHFVRPVLKPWMLRRIVSCGSPNFLNNLAGRITSILMNVLLLGYGGESAAFPSTASSCTRRASSSPCSTACAIPSSLRWATTGEPEPTRGCGPLSAAALRPAPYSPPCPWRFSASFPPSSPRLFLPDGDAAFMAESLTALRIFALTYLTRWFSFAAQSYMLAVGNALPASLLSVANALVFPVLLVVLLSPLGLTGLWLNFPRLLRPHRRAGPGSDALVWAGACAAASARRQAHHDLTRLFIKEGE